MPSPRYNRGMLPSPKQAIGPPQDEAGGLLTIDLDAIVANWRILKGLSGNAETAAVVKADAYGCGIAPVGKALANAGCRTFFVAHVFEGRCVRAIAPDAAVYVLNGLPPGTSEAFAAADLRPVLGSLEELREWRMFAKKTGWRGGAALHIDTGMNRLGLSVEDAILLAQSIHADREGITLLMSHLACAETPVHSLNAKQLGLFREMRALFSGVPGSLANSSGIFLGPDALHDLVRPGVALYGANPTPGHMNPMHPVVTLQGRVVQVREIASGDSVGYGATWIASRDSRIAIVSIGYADGLLRSVSSSGNAPRAEVGLGDKRSPVVGRISMDLLAVDVTDIGGRAPTRGDWVTLLDDNFGVDELAAHAGTIGYEILTSLGSRYHRTYRGKA